MTSGKSIRGTLVLFVALFTTAASAETYDCTSPETEYSYRIDTDGNLEVSYRGSSDTAEVGKTWFIPKPPRESEGCIRHAFVREAPLAAYTSEYGEVAALVKCPDNVRFAIKALNDVTGLSFSLSHREADAHGVPCEEADLRNGFQKVFDGIFRE